MPLFCESRWKMDDSQIDANSCSSHYLSDPPPLTVHCPSFKSPALKTLLTLKREGCFRSSNSKIWTMQIIRLGWVVITNHVSEAEHPPLQHNNICQFLLVSSGQVPLAVRLEGGFFSPLPWNHRWNAASPMERAKVVARDAYQTWIKSGHLLFN